jgi:hypothetical protein
MSDETKTEETAETKQPAFVFNVIKHPTGFYDVVQIVTHTIIEKGALASFEINKFLDTMCEKENLPKDAVVVRVFSVTDVEDKERL